MSTEETPNTDKHDADSGDGEHVAANSGEQVTANANQQQNISSAGLRQAIQAWLGASLFEGRDYYDTFDWPTDIDEEQYYATYTRNPFAKPVVDRPAFTSWRDDPIIVDDGDDEQTDFQQDVEKANRELDLWSYAERLDRLAGIGRYGVLVFVTSDVEQPDDLSAEFSPGDAPGDGLDKINQIKVFSEVSVDNIRFGDVNDAQDGRWGKPTEYSIDFSPEAETEEDKNDAVYDVHWSRTVAVPATRLLDDDFFGRPRLEPVYNVLKDIEKVLGSVAELAYRGADKGLAINYDPDKVDSTFMKDNDQDLQEWLHGLQPAFQTAGADIQELGGQIADATGIFEPQLSALAAATGIPKRVFEGDPAGALASAEEDTQAFFGMIKERRSEYNTPHIARPIIDWVLDNDLISDPSTDGNHYGIEWEPLRVLSEMEQAELATERLESIDSAVTVKEARKMHGLEPQPEWMDDEIANSYLTDLGGGGGPGDALEEALEENRASAQTAARNQVRMQRGQEADD